MRDSMQRLRQQPTEEEDLRINIKAILMPSLDWVEDVVIVGDKQLAFAC